MCQHCIMCMAVSQLCVKDPLLGLLMGMGQRGEAPELPTHMSLEKLEICKCSRLGSKQVMV